MRCLLLSKLTATLVVFSAILFPSVVLAQEAEQNIFKQTLENLFKGEVEPNLPQGDVLDEDEQSSAQVIRVPASRVEIQLSFAPLVKQVAASVVNVYATKKPRQVSPFAGDPFFERFFGNRNFGGRPRDQNSLGSGVIVSQDGIVITNHHVIKDADQVRIALSDGREFEAEIILKDEESDLAVLQVRADETFPALELGDSDEPLVGDLVLAIGNPFGVGQTVTSGIISAVARSSRGVNDFGFFLQTDAAINPGNSGGALVDMNGRLIGINTAIFSRSGGSNGIGFAIPSNMVRVALQSAETGDTLTRPWIGASFQQVTPDIAQAIGLARPRGALVTEVVEGGPADKAGLQSGDVIVAVNGKRIPHVNALGYRLTTVGIGNEANLRVLSRGKRETRTLVLIEAPETVPANETLLPAQSALGGAMVANLSPAISFKLKIPTDKFGVVVLDVQSRSAAAGMRILPGDIIRRINDVEVKRVADLGRALRVRTNRWRILVERRGREIVLDRNGRRFRQYLR